LKRLSLPTLLLLLLLPLSHSFAGDFDKGFMAYEAGNYAAALNEFTSLAEQGEVRAQFLLAQMYRRAQGVIEDDKESVKWYRLAAEQGIVTAQNWLGFVYQNGNGVVKDDREAARWFRLASEQGLANAQNNLGFAYKNGDGVIQDNVYAHMWFNVAASSGYEDAKKNGYRLARKMTREQIAIAQDLARECIQKNHKNC
jgi:uncharacterized protein